MKNKRYVIASFITFICIVLIISNNKFQVTLIKIINIALSIIKNFSWLVFLATICILILIIILLTITYHKQKKAETALRASEKLLRTVINSLPDIICFKDADGRWIEANDAMLKIYNTKVPIIGKTDKELSELLPEFREEFEACQKTDALIWKRSKITMVEESFHQPNGETRTFDVAKVPLFYDDGKRQGLVVLGREITERKKAEEIKLQAEESNRLLMELKQYDKIKTEFFANISHELRTPLNLILTPTQLMKIILDKNSNDKNYEKLNSYVNIIRQNSFRLIKIVNNIIDITKIDSGYMQLQLQKVNIVQIIEDITLSIKDYVEQKGISLIFDTDAEEKFTYCDLDKLERIVLNLLSNAVKFSKPGGSIEVSLKDLEHNIEVSVKDTGIGIPKDRQALVFERFVQVDKSLSRNKEGSGIGLSLVKSFIEMHKGNIYINSNYDKGTEFIFTIPIIEMINEVYVANVIQHNLPESKIELIDIEFSDIYS